MMQQGDPCPNCGVPVYAAAGVSVPGGCLRMVWAALKSVVTVARGGVGSVQVGEVPQGPVEATCVNCRARMTVMVQE